MADAPDPPTDPKTAVPPAAPADLAPLAGPANPADLGLGGQDAPATEQKTTAVGTIDEDEEDDGKDADLQIDPKLLNQAKKAEKRSKLSQRLSGNNSATSRISLRLQSRESIAVDMDQIRQAIEIITKCEAKRIDQSKTEVYMRKKGIDQDLIEEAYEDYFDSQGMYEKTIVERPLGFSIVGDSRGLNALVSSFQNEDQTKGVTKGSRIIAVNGKRVDEKPHTDIIAILKEEEVPICIRFETRAARKRKRAERKAREAKEKKDKEEARKSPKKKSLAKSPSLTTPKDDGGITRVHSSVFKVEEMTQWNQQDQDMTKDEMLMELSRLMHVTTYVGKKDPTMKLLSKKSRTAINTLAKVNKKVRERTSETDDKRTAFDEFKEKETIKRGELDDYTKAVFARVETVMDDAIAPQQGAVFGMANNDAFLRMSTDQWTQESSLSVPGVRVRRSSVPDDGTDADVNALNEMKRGTAMLKYDKKAKKGNFRAFQITPDNRNLIWYSGKKTLESTTVPLTEVLQIVSGNTHESFKGKPAEVRNCSFVVEYLGKDGKKKELTISAKTEFESLMWQQGLSILADHNQGKGIDAKMLKQIAFKAPKSGTQRAKSPSGGAPKRSDTIRDYVSKANKAQEKEDGMLKECLKQMKKFQLVSTMLKNDKIKSNKQFSDIKEDVTDLDLRLQRVKDTLEKERVYDKTELKQELWLVSVDLIALKGKLAVLIREEQSV